MAPLIELSEPCPSVLRKWGLHVEGALSLGSNIISLVAPRDSDKIRGESQKNTLVIGVQSEASITCEVVIEVAGIQLGGKHFVDQEGANT